MPRVRYPFAESFMNRNGSINQTKDVYIVNGCVDKYRDKLYVMKRPGTTSAGAFGAAGNSQGGFWFNGFFYSVVGDVLYREGSAQNSGTDGTAFTQATMPAWYGRSFFTATVFQNRIYVIGGQAPGTFSDINYSSDGVVWSQNASGAPFGHRQGHQTVVFQGQLVLMGGFMKPTALTNDVWTSLDGASWTQVQCVGANAPNAPWTARVNFTAVAANNGIYIYGGQLSDGSFADDVWYTADLINWTELTATATGTPRYLHNMVFFHNLLWIIGGDDGTGTGINSVSSSPNGQNWTTTTPIWPTGRSLMAATVYNNRIWLLGGLSTGAVSNDSNVYSSPDGTTYTLVTTTPGWGERGAAQAVAFRTPYTVNQYRYDSIWLMGGNDGSNELQQVWYGNINSSLATSYPLNPATPNLAYQFNTFLNGTKLLIKNESNFWVLESGTLTEVVDTNYPTVTVPGLVVLNDFAYVMEPDGTIISCAIDDPLSWPSLQFVGASYEDDPGIAIIKYLNYLVAFGSYTVQFFYDAGNPAPGTALSPYQSASIKIGLAQPATLQTIKGTLIWIGQTESGRLSVYMMDGISPTPVSTSWIDRLITENLTANTISFVTGMSGHSFYVLSFRDSAQAVAFDVDMQQWSIWNSNTSPSPPALPYNVAVTNFVDGTQYWYGSDDLEGNILQASFDFFDDAGDAFDLIVQTDKMDADNLARKFAERLDWVSDQNAGNVLIEVTDDDYQTYQTWGTVDQSLKRPSLHRGGSFRRRALRCTQTDSNPARWEAVDLMLTQGES